MVSNINDSAAMDPHLSDGRYKTERYAYFLTKVSIKKSIIFLNWTSLFNT